MALTEDIGLMTFVDSAGNQKLMYPITKKEAVDGFDEGLAEAVAAHNASASAHPDLREALSAAQAAMVGARALRSYN